MTQIDIKYVLLYRTSERWRITVAEIPDAIGCGALSDTPPDAPTEVAQQDLLDHLPRHWSFTGQLCWTHLGTGSRAANHRNTIN